MRKRMEYWPDQFSRAPKESDQHCVYDRLQLASWTRPLSSGGAYRLEIISAPTERVWCNAYNYFVPKNRQISRLIATQEVSIGTEVIEIMWTWKSPDRHLLCTN